MKLYIASHCRWAALHVASVMEKAGHTITSRWINAPFLPTQEHSADERRQIAQNDAEDVTAADAVILISARDNGPGGKFVEAGIALGQGKPVVVLGRRENMLMYHPLVTNTDDPFCLTELLAQL